MSRTRWRSFFLPLAATLAIACGLDASSVPARHLDCDPGGMALGQCKSVALVAIRTVNREAIGPIDTVTVRAADCRAIGRSTLQSVDLMNAAHCWSIDIVGEASQGRAVVFQSVQDGPLQPGRL